MSVWFITGCSSGFGLGLARLALQAGHKVIATSRTPSKTPELVSEISSLGGTWLALDVCSPSLSQILDHALSVHGHIDYLVNNAGSSLLGPLEDISDTEARSIMDINFFAPLNIIRHVLPSMRARRSGTIVNISSTQGLVAYPCTGIYAASKHALEGASEALSQEVAPFNIRVLIIEPGGFNTNFASSIATPAKPLSSDYVGTPVERVMKGIASLPGNLFGDTEKACRAIFDVATKTGLSGELKEEYLRIPLGSDCAGRLRRMVEVLGRTLDGTKPVWESTDLAGREGRERTTLYQKTL